MPASVEQIVSRAAELLRALAMCDIEGVSAHRNVLLENLRQLEAQASALGVQDLYDAVMHSFKLLMDLS